LINNKFNEHPKNYKPFELIVNNDILNIKYYGYLDNDPQHYVNTFFKNLKLLDKKYTFAKIIIDLTKNIGGNGWPMLMSLAPIFYPIKTISYFAIMSGYNKYKYSPVRFKYNDNYHLGNLSYNLFTLKNNINKIYIKLGNNTFSSGEWMVVSLLSLVKNYDIKYFGDTTGVYNSINTYFIKDNGFLNITCGYFADFNKTIIKGPLKSNKLNKLVNSYH
jgi:hypothetical protein